MRGLKSPNMAQTSPHPSRRCRDTFPAGEGFVLRRNRVLRIYPGRGRLSFRINLLLLCGRSYRTSICTATAADALISVDNILAVTLGNATGGTCVSACAARDALIGNLVCHSLIPPFLYATYIVACFFEKSRVNLKNVALIRGRFTPLCSRPRHPSVFYRISVPLYRAPYRFSAHPCRYPGA